MLIVFSCKSILSKEMFSIKGSFSPLCISIIKIGDNITLALVSKDFVNEFGNNILRKLISKSLKVHMKESKHSTSFLLLLETKMKNSLLQNYSGFLLFHSPYL